MALPQKAIEQLSREPVQTPGWSSKLLMWSSTLFFISLATYFGLRFGYQPYLITQQNEVQDEIERFTQQIPVEEQEKIITFYSQLANVRTLLANQTIASALMPWLESYTHQSVSFSSFSANLAQATIAMTGEALTLTALAEQIAAFQETPDVLEFEFPGAAKTDEGRWGFTVNLTLDPALFAAALVGIEQ